MFYVVRFFCYISIEYIEMLISLTYSRRNTRLKDLEFFNIKHLIIKRENTMNTTILTQIWSMITVSFLAFSFSVSIEMLQLFLRLGTFQLSDIFYNTVGGVVGGLVYYATIKARKRL